MNDFDIRSPCVRECPSRHAECRLHCSAYKSYEALRISERDAAVQNSMDERLYADYIARQRRIGRRHNVRRKGGTK